MAVKFWPKAVPSDTELRRLSLGTALWVVFTAYGFYTLVLMFTAPPTFLVDFLVLCAGLHVLGLVAFHAGWPLAAAVWMTLVMLLCFTLMNVYGFTDAQSAEYYFVLVPALIFMVLPPEKRELQITLLTLTLALMTFCFILPEPEQPWFVMSPEQYLAFKWLDLTVGFLCMAVVCRYFIHRLLQQRNQLERLALTDTLTGLPNRHGMMQQLAAWYNEGRHFSVLLLDVDDFRAINRRHGQDVGDVLMRKLSRRLRDDIEEPTLIARVGGDQFMLASDVVTAGPAVLDLAQRIQVSASRLAFDLGGRSERVEVSIGATLSRDNEEPQALNQRLAQSLLRARARVEAPRIHLLLPDSPPGGKSELSPQAASSLAARL